MEEATTKPSEVEIKFDEGVELHPAVMILNLNRVRCATGTMFDERRQDKLHPGHSRQ